MKILILTGDAKTLLYHRGELLKAFAGQGLEIVAAASEDLEHVRTFIEDLGGRYESLPIDRSGLNPLRDLHSLRAIYQWIRREQPDYFFAYAIKSVAYGMIAAKLAGVRHRFALVPGLGYAFTPDGTWKQRLVHLVSRLLYRISLRFAEVVFLQNEDDERLLRREGIIQPGTCTHVTHGSGVELGEFPYRPTDLSDYPERRPMRFVLVSRLLKNKGIRQYAEAARILREEGFAAEFHLVGPLDPSPDAVREIVVKNWQAAGTLIYHGSQREIAPFLAQADVFVLPTYYREGVPRSILEALSVGLPIVTTYAVGSRETVKLNETGIFAQMLGEPVIEGRNGFLVEPRNTEALVAALRLLLEHPDRLSSMGRISRNLAEHRFDVARVNAGILTQMGLEPLVRVPELRHAA